MVTTSDFAGCRAAIFAAAGAVAGATARELARRGAELYLSARTDGALNPLADEIATATGHRPDCATVDAEDPVAIASYLEALRRRGIEPDWTFNGIGLDPAAAGYGRRAEELPLASFLAPLTRIVGSQFLTATACAASMRRRGGGTVVVLTASLAKSALPYMTGITAACDALQGLARGLAAEYGPSAVRVLCVRLAGVPETRTIRLSSAACARTLGVSFEEFAAGAGSRAGHRPLTLAAAAAAIADATAPGSGTPAGVPFDIEAAP